MSIIGSGEQHTPPRPETVHELTLTHQCSNGVAICHGFSKGAQIRCHLADVLVAAEAVAKPRNHLVEDQHDAVRMAQIAQGKQEFGSWQDTADVVWDDLNENGCNLVVSFAECFLNRLNVVEGQDNRLPDHLGQHTERQWVVLTNLLCRTGHIHKNRVVPTMIAALKLNDRVPTSDSPCQA